MFRNQLLKRAIRGSGRVVLLLKDSINFPQLTVSILDDNQRVLLQTSNQPISLWLLFITQ